MKKSVFIVAFIVTSLVSCNKEAPINTLDENKTSTTEIVFELTANHPDGATTKAVKTGWENGDVIFVFFDNVAAPKYLKMSYDGSAWSNTQMNGAAEESLGLVENATGTMRAVYLPFGNDATVSNDGTSFTFSETTYSYYLTATLDYTVTGGKVSGAFDMQIPEGYIQFFLDDASATSSTEIELREPHLTPQGIASIAANGTIAHTEIAHGAPLPGYVYDKATKETGESKGYLFSGILASDARNASTTYYFTLVIDGWEGTYYSKSFENKTWYRGESEGRALKIPALSNWTEITDYKPIDLGFDYPLTLNTLSRVYVSSCNYGASSPEEYGNYYAWGETATKTVYSWKKYKYGTSETGPFSKYNSNSDYGVVDNLYRLETGPDGDDVASKDLGEYWHIPTSGEISHLVVDCAYTYTTVNSKKGYLFTSIIPGYTGRSVFLPLAGFKDGYTTEYAGKTGIYWSADLMTSTPARVCCLSLQTTPQQLVSQFGGSERFYGNPIRPFTY